MQRDGNGRERERFPRIAANDNPGSKAGPGRDPGAGPEARIEDAVMRLARLLGRQIARERFVRPDAANDNKPEDNAGEK